MVPAIGIATNVPNNPAISNPTKMTTKIQMGLSPVKFPRSLGAMRLSLICCIKIEKNASWRANHQFCSDSNIVTKPIPKVAPIKGMSWDIPITTANKKANGILITKKIGVKL